MKSYFSSEKNVATLVVVCCMAVTLFMSVSIYQEIQSRSENQYPKVTNDDFTLTGHLGSKISLSDYTGKTVILVFGYTHCPDICSMELSQMKEIMEKLGDKADKLQVLFITVDPERDTPETMKKYVTHFHPSFMGLTGTAEEISKVAKQYKVLYKKQETESKAGYLMGHSYVVYLINKQGQFDNAYRLNHKTSFWKQMKKDLLKLI